MTEHELNCALAEALGWRKAKPYELWIWALPDGSGLMDFTPATSTDHLREHVLPLLERRGQFRAWVNALVGSITDKQLEAAFAATGVLPAQFQVDPQEAGYVLASVMWGAGAYALAAAALEALRGEEVKP